MFTLGQKRAPVALEFDLIPSEPREARWQLNSYIRVNAKDTK